MLDYRAMANALIQALNGSTQAGLNKLDIDRRNFAEDINNRAAKRGTLYSTGGAAQRSRYDATQYLPGRSQLISNQQQQELRIRGDVAATAQKIDAINKAADELNGIDDAYFESLLT